MQRRAYDYLILNIRWMSPAITAGFKAVIAETSVAPRPTRGIVYTREFHKDFLLQTYNILALPPFTSLPSEFSSYDSPWSGARPILPWTSNMKTAVVIVTSTPHFLKEIPRSKDLPARIVQRLSISAFPY
jgi:hypothetical protein